MSAQALIQQVIAGLVQNPSMLTNLMEHPYSTVKDVTGNQDVSKEEVAETVAGVSALANGQAIDFGQLGNLAQSLLGQNGGSVHQLASSLFGGAATGGTNNGLSAGDMLGNLAGVAFSGNQAGAKVDLSDGIQMDDIMGLASMLLGGKK